MGMATDSLLRQLNDPALGGDERAELCCTLAAEFEDKGDYDAARDALGPLWRGVGQRPSLDGLSARTAARVLLRAGALTGWLGSVRQIEGAQEAAKDLLSESISRFESLGERALVAASLVELGFCYRRAGAYDEARVIYDKALRSLPAGEDELRAKILLRLVVVESCSGRYHDSLRILTESSDLFESARTPHLLKGKFHNELGAALHVLSRSERRAEYMDRAIIEYTAAAHHFAEARHASLVGTAENNLGFLLYRAGRFADAHEHLSRAREIFKRLGETGRIAQVDDARARVMLAEGRPEVAARVIRDAVATLERGDELAILSEALTTRGLVLARLGSYVESQRVLRRAATVAEQAGAPEDAGLALLAFIEEHAERVEEHELLESYRRADGLLKGTQDAETAARLRACAAAIVSSRLAVVGPRRGRSAADFWANFNLADKVLEYEARYIRRALLETDGSVTRASRLLGFSHHGTLQSALEGRHKELARLRTPPEKRYRSYTSRRPLRRKANCRAVVPAPAPAARPASVMHVEDNDLVARLVNDTLTMEGMGVETITTGPEAESKLRGNDILDLLIFDYDLPGTNGIELVKLARSLPHRAATPIIMFSASEVEPEARAAGVDEYLRKPEDIGLLVETSTRLLKK